MEGAVQLVVMMVGLIVVWINWSPSWEKNFHSFIPAAIFATAGFLFLPNWFGWVLLAIAASDWYITYQRVQRDPKAIGPISMCAKAAPGFLSWLSLRLISQATQLKRELRPLLKRWTGAVFAIKPENRIRFGVATLTLAVVGLIAAIPVFLTAELVITLIQVVTGNVGEIEFGWKDILEATIGGGLVAWLVTVGAVINVWFLSLPLVLVTAFLCERFFDRTAERWFPSAKTILAMAVLYTLPYLVAVILGVYEQPYID